MYATRFIHLTLFSEGMCMRRVCVGTLVHPERTVRLSFLSNSCKALPGAGIISFAERIRRRVEALQTEREKLQEEMDAAMVGSRAPECTGNHGIRCR